MPTPAQIEAKAREIYLGLYGSIGGKWEAVETKDVWRDKAREVFQQAAHDEPHHLTTRIWILSHRLDQANAVIDRFWRNSLIIESAIRDKEGPYSVAHNDITAAIRGAQEYIKQGVGSPQST